VIDLEPETDGPRTRVWLAEEEPLLLKKEIVMPGFGEIVWELKTGG
jgi:hypothetical protein